MFLKRTQKWLTSIALLVVIVSFSGFINYPSYPQKPQTELIVSNSYSNQVTNKSFIFLKCSSQKATFNQYTTFCFKWLLITYQYNFNITFKSQKVAQLKFNSLTILEQNLIAKVFSNEQYCNFIK